MHQGALRNPALPLLRCSVELRVKDRQLTLLDSSVDTLSPRLERLKVLLVARDKLIVAAAGVLREKFNGQLDDHLLDAIGHGELHLVLESGSSGRCGRTAGLSSRCLKAKGNGLEAAFPQAASVPLASKAAGVFATWALQGVMALISNWPCAAYHSVNVLYVVGNKRQSNCLNVDLDWDSGVKGSWRSVSLMRLSRWLPQPSPP